MINLVPRFYEASAGVITLDGVAVTDLAPADLRAAVALVSQEQVLFDDSIANNIRLGRLMLMMRSGSSSQGSSGT